MFLLIFILFWGCFFQTIQTAPCEKSFTTAFVTLGSRPIPGVLRGIVSINNTLVLTTSVEDRNVMTCDSQYCTGNIFGFEDDRRVGVENPIVIKNNSDIFLHGTDYMYVCDAEKDWTEGAGRFSRDKFNLLGTRCRSKRFISLPVQLWNSRSVFGMQENSDNDSRGMFLYWVNSRANVSAYVARCESYYCDGVYNRTDKRLPADKGVYVADLTNMSLPQHLHVLNDGVTALSVIMPNPRNDPLLVPKLLTIHNNNNNTEFVDMYTSVGNRTLSAYRHKFALSNDEKLVYQADIDGDFYMIVFDREKNTGVRNKLLDVNKDLNDIKQKLNVEKVSIQNVFTFVKSDDSVVVTFTVQTTYVGPVMQYHCADRMCSSGELFGPVGTPADRFNVTSHVATLNEDKTTIITAYTTNLNNLASLHVCGAENKTLEARDEPGQYCTNPIALTKLNEKQEFTIDDTSSSPLSPGACSRIAPITGALDDPLRRSSYLPAGPRLNGRGVWLAPDFDQLGVDCVTVKVCALTNTPQADGLYVNRYTSSCPDPSRLVWPVCVDQRLFAFNNTRRSQCRRFVMARPELDTFKASTLFVLLEAQQGDAKFDVQLEYDSKACAHFTPPDPIKGNPLINATRSTQFSMWGDLPELPVLCHSYYVPLHLQEDRGNYDYDEARSNPAGVPVCFEEEECRVGYLYFGHMFKFMGFVNATGMFDQVCRYSAANQGVVCDVSQSPEPVYSVRGSAVVHLMPLCVTDSINRKAHAYIEGTMLDKREFLKNPVPIKVPPLTTSTSSSGSGRFYSTLRVKSKCNAPDFSDNCNLCPELARCPATPLPYEKCSRNDCEPTEACRTASRQATIDFNQALEASCPFNPNRPPSTCTDLPSPCIIAMAAARPGITNTCKACAECDEGFCFAAKLLFELCLDGSIGGGGGTCQYASAGTAPPHGSTPYPTDANGEPIIPQGTSENNGALATMVCTWLMMVALCLPLS